MVMVSLLQQGRSGWIGNGSWLTIYLSLAASYRARLVGLAMVHDERFILARLHLTGHVW